MNSPSVFLSYTHEDRPWAEAFAEALRQQGISLCLYPSDLAVGDNRSEALGAALRQSETLVLILGPESAGKPALFLELGAALALRKRIIPILSEGVKPVPLLRTRSLLRKDPQKTAEEVVRAVAA